MDKKNTMLLTVIAVATLLVAVVGATFAYFTASTSSEGVTNTTVSGQVSGNPGSLTATTKTAALHMNLTLAHMQKTPESMGNYYATVADETSTKTEATHELVTFTSADGSANANYECKYTFTVQATGVQNVTDTDGTVKLTGTSGITFDPTTTTFDLKALATAQTVEATVTLEGNDTETISVQAYITNRDANHNHLGDLDATVTIAAGTFSCEQTK